MASSSGECPRLLVDLPQLEVDVLLRLSVVAPTRYREAAALSDQDSRRVPKVRT